MATIERLDRAPSIEAADGGTAVRDGAGIALLDREGRLLVRYEDGVLVVSPPTGDLVLGSATGAVRIQAASDVVLEARRDVRVMAPRRVELGVAAHSRIAIDPRRVTVDGDEALISARRCRIEGERAEIVVQSITTKVKEAVTVAERWSVSAANAVLSTREMLQEVSGALTSKLGRFRGVVREVYSLRSGRTDLRSKEDTSIDGKRVLLG